MGTQGRSILKMSSRTNRSIRWLHNSHRMVSILHFQNQLSACRELEGPPNHRRYCQLELRETYLFPRPRPFVRIGTDQDECSSEPGAKIKMHSLQCLLPVRSGPHFHHQSWVAFLSSVYSVSPARCANSRSATPGYQGH